jgi:hypothetical protein
MTTTTGVAAAGTAAGTAIRKGTRKRRAAAVGKASHLIWARPQGLRPWGFFAVSQQSAASFGNIACRPGYRRYKNLKL